MKRVICSLLILIMASVTVSCSVSKSEQDEVAGESFQCAEEPLTEMEEFVPEYDRLVRLGADFEHAIVFESDIDWLSFSFSDDEELRTTIKEYLNEEIAVIRMNMPNFDPPIAISKYDINNDGAKEIIAFLGGSTAWGGGHSTGAFRVYFFQDDAIVSEISLPGFSIDIETLGESKQFGVIRRPEGMCDLFILSRLFVWDGGDWSNGMPAN